MQSLPIYEASLPGISQWMLACVWTLAIVPALGMILPGNDAGLGDVVLSLGIIYLIVGLVILFLLRLYRKTNLTLCANRIVYQVVPWRKEPIRQEMLLADIINIEYANHFERYLFFDPFHGLTLRQITITDRNRQTILLRYPLRQNDRFLAICAAIEYRILLPEFLSTFEQGDHWHTIFAPSFNASLTRLSVIDDGSAVDALEPSPEKTIRWDDIVSLDAMTFGLIFPAGGMVTITGPFDRRLTARLPRQLPHVFMAVAQKYAFRATVKASLIPFDHEASLALSQSIAKSR